MSSFNPHIEIQLCDMSTQKIFFSFRADVFYINNCALFMVVLIHLLHTAISI